jgi:hypothetical protein
VTDLRYNRPVYAPYQTSDHTWLIHNLTASTEFPAFENTDGLVTLHPTQEAAEMAAHDANNRVWEAIEEQKRERDAPFDPLVIIYVDALENAIDDKTLTTTREVRLAPILAVRDAVLNTGDDRILKTEAPDDALQEIFNKAYDKASEDTSKGSIDPTLAGVRALSHALLATYRVDHLR